MTESTRRADELVRTLRDIAETANRGRVPRPPVLHEVTFQSNQRTGRHLAKCACGWMHFDDSLEECQKLAAGHDIDWQAVSA